MAETKKFGDALRAFPDYLQNNRALPDTAAENSNNVGLIGQVQGALEVHVRVTEVIALTGDLTVKLQESDSEDGTYTDIPGASVAKTNPTDAVDTDFAKFALNSDVKPWIRAVVTTTATPSTGKLSIFPAHIAR